MKELPWECVECALIVNILVLISGVYAATAQDPFTLSAAAAASGSGMQVIISTTQQQLIFSLFITPLQILLSIFSLRHLNVVITFLFPILVLFIVLLFVSILSLVIRLYLDMFMNTA